MDPDEGLTHFGRHVPTVAAKVGVGALAEQGGDLRRVLPQTRLNESNAGLRRFRIGRSNTDDARSFPSFELCAVQVIDVRMRAAEEQQRRPEQATNCRLDQPTASGDPQPANSTVLRS